MGYTVKDLKTDILVPSENNRKDLGNGDLKELAESIKLQGVLVPLIVRELGKPPTIFVVAGHRRLEAAKMAGLETVPCIIRKLEDYEAVKIQVVENLHRKNLNPMDEARGFEALRQNNAHSAQTISELVGKEVKYVYRSLQLLDLPAAAVKALENGVLTAAHGHQLVRIGEKQMAATLKYAITKNYHNNIPSVEDLKSFISQRVEKNLALAPWDKKVEYAKKIACEKCPSNSGNQGLLFDGATEGKCTNGACYSIKLNQFYKDLREKGHKRWPTLKFIGAATSAYGDKQTIKGYVEVEGESPAVKKAIDHEGKNTPADVAQLGFGIIKPSMYGNTKKAKLVVLKKLPKGATPHSMGNYVAATPEQLAKNDHIESYISVMMAKRIFDSCDVGLADIDRSIVQKAISSHWRSREWGPWFLAAGASSENKSLLPGLLDRLDNAAMEKLGFWLRDEITPEETREIVAEKNKFNLKGERKSVGKLAEKSWNRDKSKIVEAWKKRRIQ